jgi:hypothetical protein
MKNEQAKYKMSHIEDYPESDRNYLEDRCCSDCSMKNVKHIKGCVVLKEIHTSIQYFYCKSHATKWFLKYARTGDVLTLNHSKELTTYCEYDFCGSTLIEDKTVAENYKKVAGDADASNCNLNYNNNVECNEKCGATNCTNNVVRRSRIINKTIPIISLLKQMGKCYVQEVSEKLGIGVFSSEKISNNETIIEFVGELMTVAKLQEYVQKSLSENDDEQLYCHHLDENHWIDAEYLGNISRYINHSCNPNAKLKYWTVRDFAGKLSNMFLFST